MKFGNSGKATLRQPRYFVSNIKALKGTKRYRFERRTEKYPCHVASSPETSKQPAAMLRLLQP
ncbi:hypothetical protein ATO67_05255 [Agrobacterium bohemicum]|uniref:Uncharacterized protein n=1 Tax=Agrobacterium bohemicum TaxID=2052828 RepID=A0A135P3M5_9HYPH|nr:hypothetical protein ATO67_05255 [Agrobacterium bohemicum]